ncbi:hypothetical protein C8R44DRAFT_869489 [Mycena epipterygia]|nr:hypothetical protein C8R44DRAFT_869489 [Mycena epipterygia]
MAFVSAKRSDEKHAALRERLTTCQCNPRNPIYHRPVYRPLHEVLELCLSVMCATISDYFMRIGPGKFKKAKENTPPEAQPWPSRIADIIPAPGGEEEVLLGLVQWAAHVPGGHSIFSLIGGLARFWDPFAVQLFRTPGVFELAMDHLQCAFDAYDPRASPGDLMFGFITPVIACAQGLFYTLFEMDLSRTLTLIAPMYERMYAIAVPIEPILLRLKQTYMPMDDCRRWFHLVRKIRRYVAPDGTWIRRPEGTSPPVMDAFTHYGAAFHRMVEIRNRNQCLHIACTSKIQARSSVCSRCGIVRYCSRECLEAAWDAPRLPHKSLCKQIAALRAATLLGADKAWNHAVRDSQVHRSPADFAYMCTAMGVNPRVSEAIWRGILLLTQEKMRFAFEAEERVASQEMVIEGNDDTMPDMASSGEVMSAPPVWGFLEADGVVKMEKHAAPQDMDNEDVALDLSSEPMSANRVRGFEAKAEAREHVASLQIDIGEGDDDTMWDLAPRCTIG